MPREGDVLIEVGGLYVSFPLAPKQWNVNLERGVAIPSTLRVRRDESELECYYCYYDRHNKVEMAETDLIGKPGPITQMVLDYEAACKRMDRSAAGRRARELLFSHLDEEQMRTVERDNYFDIRVLHPESKKRAENGEPIRVAVFRITRGFAAGNVMVLSPQRPSFTICIHPPQPFPTDDIHLAQKLMIEHELDRFVAEGNFSRQGIDVPIHRLFRPEETERKRRLKSLVVVGERE